MAIKITSFGGADWVNGDVLGATDLIETMEQAPIQARDTYVWNELSYISAGVAVQIIIAHSASTWTAVSGGSTARTTDTGVTWNTPAADDANMTGVSRAFGAKGISCDHDGSDVLITSDSGDNWANASTDPAGTRVLSLSFPTATVAVAGMDTGTTRDIYFSTDAGDNWTVCSAGPTANVPTINMVDGSDGLAIDASQNIWTTGDGGDNWADSNQNSVAVPGTQATIIALTSSTGVLLNNSSSATIETFTTGAGGTVRLKILDANENGCYLSNLVKTNNGNLYFVQYNFNDTDSISGGMTMYRSEDSGVTWSSKPLGLSHFESDGDINTRFTKAQLTEGGNNILLLLSGQQELMIIDES